MSSSRLTPTTRRRSSPESAILLWQSFERPFLLFRCLCAEDEDLLVCTAGPSAGAGEDKSPHRHHCSSLKAGEPLSSIRRRRATGQSSTGKQGDPDQRPQRTTQRHSNQRIPPEAAWSSATVYTRPRPPRPEPAAWGQSSPCRADRCSRRSTRRKRQGEQEEEWVRVVRRSGCRPHAPRTLSAREACLRPRSRGVRSVAPGTARGVSTDAAAGSRG